MLAATFYVATPSQVFLFLVTNQLQLQQLVDFETPSGLSDAPASQKTVLESTRTSGAQQSFRQKLYQRQKS